MNKMDDQLDAGFYKIMQDAVFFIADSDTVEDDVDPAMSRIALDCMFPDHSKYMEKTREIFKEHILSKIYSLRDDIRACNASSASIKAAVKKRMGKFMEEEYAFIENLKYDHAERIRCYRALG